MGVELFRSETLMQDVVSHFEDFYLYSVCTGIPLYSFWKSAFSRKILVTKNTGEHSLRGSCCSFPCKRCWWLGQRMSERRHSGVMRKRHSQEGSNRNYRFLFKSMDVWMSDEKLSSKRLDLGGKLTTHRDEE